MINNDTVRLLKECNSGIKMGVSSINEVLPHVKNENMRELLTACRNEHEQIGNETRNILNNYGDPGSEPSSVAKGMSWIKTNVMLSVSSKDNTIAGIITDGCNMGIKSLSEYLNEFPVAEESAKGIAARLITIEDTLAKDIRSFL